ncbi:MULTISPECIES: VOC family protein [Clostridium]|uniref:VOC family protein n=1 Tax=Clostridium TaxID=1485 RepID=UPI00082565C9|nr:MULTISPECIES: VOC family protein [Clostridium]PJI08221.1 VOC family protein [Clostridium sp. CT7]
MDEKLIGGIHHVCMKVKDIQQTVDFYTEKMNYKIRLQWDGGAMLKAPDGTHIEIFPEDEEKGYAHVAYVCSDVDEAYKQALSYGCESVKAPVDITIPSNPPLKARIAFFKDINGNKIELFHECN